MKELVQQILSLCTRAFPVFTTRLLYRFHLKKWPDLRKPKSFTEKLQWLKLNRYTNNYIVTKCIDKNTVREYVKQCGCSEILNEQIGVWDDPSAIEWNKLPDKFALKCNHGCGYNIVCQDKTDLDERQVKRQLTKWLASSYGLSSAETVYYNITPKVICDRYIESDTGYLLDYKIFCNYGVPKFLYVISGGHEENECIDYFTTSWEWIPVQCGTIPNADVKPQKPKQLDRMLEYASKLSEDFPIVRVDLYCTENSIMFGELTFLPTAGFIKFNPGEYDYIFGRLFEIDHEKGI